MPVCPLDIVIAIDLSPSTFGPNPIQQAGSRYGHPINQAYEAERKLLEDLIDYLTPGMLAGEIQVGVTFWASSAASLNPDGFSMSSNPYGDLSTNNTPNHPLALQDPNGDWHSVISKKMYDFYVGNSLGGGTSVNGALNSVFQLPTGALNLKTTSDFASQYPIRSNDPNFSQVGVIITDSQGSPPSGVISTGCSYQSNQLPSIPGSGWLATPSGPANQYVFGCTVTGNPFPTTPGPGLYDNVRDTLDSITCRQNAGSNSWNTSALGSAGNYGFYVYTNALLGSSQHVLTVASAIIDQSCSGVTLATYVCSGASGVGHPGGTPWDCYNPGTGLGTSWSACMAACQAPPPVTYNCSGASGVGHPSGLQWQCYDPGTGLGTYQGLNALINCQSFCQTPDTYDCSGPPNWNCSVVTGGGGQFTNATALQNGYPNPLIECQNVCFATPPSPSWDCTENTTVVSQGIAYGPWTCYDPGTGLGQHSSLAACQNICVVPPSWDCHMPAPGTTTGICIDPGNGLGQYLVEQDCIDACKTHVIYPPDEPLKVSWNCRMDKYGIGHCDLVLGTSGTYATKALCLAACEQVPILPTFTFPDTWKCHIPWHSIVGTCTKMTDGSGTYTTEQDCIDNCLHAQLLPTLLDTEGWNCDNSTQTCSGPVLGGTYPTQADCQAVCVGIISVGTLCDRVRSCPCGWTYDQTTQECESPIYGIQTMIIGAIENCITFQSPPHQPVVGDIWANLSPSNIPPPYTWNAAEVVEIGGQIQGTSSIEVRSQC